MILLIILLPFFSFSNKILPALINFNLTDSSGILPSSLSNTDYRAIGAIDKKYASLNNLIRRRTVKTLERMKKRELALQQALQSKDSLKARELFGASRAKYDQLIKDFQTPVDQKTAFPLKEYVPGADSTHTALRFLEQGAGLQVPSAGQMQRIRNASEQIQQVEAKLQRSEDIQQYLGQRELQLKAQLSQYGLGKELSGINQEAFYAQQQLVEYKSMINDKQKLEEGLLSKLNQQPAFTAFMKKNSYLGQLFSLPDNYGSVQTLTGLQTRAQVDQLIGQFTNVSGGNNAGADPTQFLQQQMQQAQQQISTLKDKLKALGISGGSGDITMPQTRPNDERTKTFLHRMEYGFGMQTQQTTTILPALANLSFTVGYKLNQKSSFGVGVSYRLGVGTGLNHVSFSNQGIGFNSYIDVYLKGNFGINGGVEYNYMQGFTHLPSIYQADIWQTSGLIGLIKRTKVAAKKSATVQLLYDVFYRQHIPSSAPLVFRVGYVFK